MYHDSTNFQHSTERKKNGAALFFPVKPKFAFNLSPDVQTISPTTIMHSGLNYGFFFAKCLMHFSICKIFKKESSRQFELNILKVMSCPLNEDYFSQVFQILNWFGSALPCGFFKQHEFKIHKFKKIATICSLCILKGKALFI